MHCVISIISDDLFYEVQDMMDKKKKAPARAKAAYAALQNQLDRRN